MLQHPDPAFPAKARRLNRPPAWLPWAAAVCVFILAVGITAWLDHNHRQQRAAEARRQALAEATGIRDRLESAINQKLTLSRSLVAYVAANPKLSHQEFILLARHLLAQEPGIRAVQLAQNNIISHTYPLAGNGAAMGLDLMGRADQRPQIERAILSRRTVVAGPIRIVQGGDALIGRSPIFTAGGEGSGNPGAYWGLANILVNTENLFNEQLLEHTSGRFRFAVRGQNARGASGAVIWGEPELFKGDPVLVEVQLPDGSWQIGALPLNGWLPMPHWWTWTCGILIGLLAAGLVWLLIRTPLKLREQVHAATQELRRNERRFRAITTNLPAPLLIQGAGDGRVIYANQGLAELLDTPAEALVGHRLADLPLPERGYRPLLELLAKPEALTARELALQPRSGRRAWYSLSIQEIDYGGQQAYMATLLDITACKAAEEVTATLNRELESRVAERTEALAEQKSFWQALAQAQSDVDEGVFVIENGRIIFANEALSRISGYSVDEITSGLLYTELIHPDVRETVMAKHRRRLAGERLETRYETLFQTRQGRPYAAELAVSLITHEPNPRVVVVVRDIDARKRNEDALRAQAAALEAAGEMIVITDRNAVVQYVNPAFTRHTGYSRQEALGQPVSVLMKSGIHDHAFYSRLWQTILAGREWHGEVTNRRKDGTFFISEQTIAPILSARGDITGFVSIKRDVSDRKRLEAKLEQMAHFDPLTGLPNRALFFDRFGQALRHAKRSKRQAALLFIDLDGFKSVNDSLGHEAGDALLQEAALRVTSCIRECDTAARMGGDEFTVILDTIKNHDDAEAVAVKLLAALDTPFNTAGVDCHISASIGISYYPEDGTDPEILLTKADMAMYAAKRSGKNRCCSHGMAALSE